MGVVARTPHDPGGSTSRCAGESEQLHASVALEGLDRNNTVLDGRGGTGTDGQGAGHFEDQAQNHGPAVADGARRHASSPSVGDIIYGAKADQLQNFP